MGDTIQDGYKGENVGTGTNFDFDKILILYHSCIWRYICGVADSFKKQVIFNKKPLLAVIVPQLRKDGMYYEVNIKGYPRFYMSWSALDRYDLAPDDDNKLPYELVLAVSDAIEKSRQS